MMRFLRFWIWDPWLKGIRSWFPKDIVKIFWLFRKKRLPRLLPALKKVGNAVMQATGAGGFHVLQNNFPAAGQTVFHLHWHIIPRSEGDGMSLWAQGTYGEGEMAELAASIAERM